MSKKLIGVICLAILLTSAGSFILLAPKNAHPGKVIGEDNEFAFGGESGNLTVNTTIPNETFSMKLYTLSVPEFNLNSAKKMVNNSYPGWLSDDVKIRETDLDENNSSIDVISFEKGDEYFEIYSCGAFYYDNNSAVKKWEDHVKKCLKDYPYSWDKYSIDSVDNPANSNSSSASTPQNDTSDYKNSSASGNGRGSGSSNETDENWTKGNGTASSNQTDDRSGASNGTGKNDTGANATSGDGQGNQSEKKRINYPTSFPMQTFEGQLSEAELINISIDYIKKHKGFPEEEYYLAYRGRGITGSITPNVTYISDYRFLFRRKIDGFPVMGEDYVKIRITPFGDVAYFKFRWAQIKGVEKNVTTVNATVALSYLDEHFHLGKPIYKIQAGYFLPQDEVPKKLSPVWIFYYHCKHYDDYICVDALNPRIIEH